jgi:CBS domain-containing protein
VELQLSLECDSVVSAYPDEPLATSPDATVAEALQLLRAQKTGAVLICDDNGLAGIFTERDALVLMASGADLSVPIAKVMSASPVTLSAQETVAEAIKKMSAGGYRHLPIVDAVGQPTGVAGVNGIVHYLVDHFPNTIYNLPPDPNSSQREREGA